MALWAGIFLLVGCGGGASAPIPVADPPSAAAPPPAPQPPEDTGQGTEAAPIDVSFSDVTLAAGVLDTDPYPEPNFADFHLGGQELAGGACAGDYDKDGWIDLYHIRGLSGPNRLYRNKGDGTFEDVAAAAGVDFESNGSSGPIFVDYDGDGWLDLFIGGTEGQPCRLVRNKGDGTFEDVTAASGLQPTRSNTVSAAFADYDGDGDLDAFLTHWELRTPVIGSPEMLWRNNGDGTFEDVSTEAGITAIYDGDYDYTFAPNFADIDSDGWLDLLIAADFGTSLVLRNKGDGTFENITTPAISDFNGMGASVVDYDNDGHLDWFVSALFRVGAHPETGPSPELLKGNRLYRNLGDGTFEDVTTEAGVRIGHWGWGSSFADFNNDGWMDIYHCNGWIGSPHFENDPSVLFLSNRDGTFQEVAVEAGIVDHGQGRGVVCFDFDNDGDVDIFQANLNESGRLYRNDSEEVGNWLRIELEADGPNTQAVGARVHIETNVIDQMRELRCGSNYVSSDPVTAWFGLGDTELVQSVRVEWSDGSVTTLEDVDCNQRIKVTQGE